MGDYPGQKILIGIIAFIVIIMLIVPLITIVASSNETIQTNDSSYSGGSSSGGSYSGGSNSGGSYKSKDPADYDSKGNYKPVETMTQEEKRQELLDILEDSLY